MTRARTAALVNFGLRTVYGVFMLAAPGRVGRPWLGDTVEAAASEVPLRGVGGREVALHVAGITAMCCGADSRLWLGASLGGDLTDMWSTFADREQLPRGLRACLLAGGGSALMTISLIAAAQD